MRNELYQFGFEIYDSSSELNDEDLELLQSAQRGTADAYAPYSDFNVGAAARLDNGVIVTGGNQENVSFPAGLCAERVVMAVAASTYPGIAISSLAISYHSPKIASDHPVSPCGICRQSLQEFSKRTGSTIRLVMGGMEGRVFIVPDASVLLPLSFTF